VLDVTGLTTRYGSIAALREADLAVQEGEIVGLIGPNGAGKTTLLNTLAGLLQPAEGTITFDGADITGLNPERRVSAGMALVPEHRKIFVDMTVEENLRIGSITRKAAERAADLDEMAELFPVLREKWSTAAGYLSGGEAQQLAIARGLMSRPKLLMLDEPSLGLAPVLVDVVFGLLDDLRASGRTLLVVEQNATRLLETADRAYVLRSGEVVAGGTGQDLRERVDLFATFVGGTADPAGGDAGPVDGPVDGSDSPGAG
jgi:branched-chain amino acid transport system ATP-binding protein